LSEQKKTTGKRQAASSPKRKRKVAVSIIGILLIVLIVLGGLGFFGYTAYSVMMSGDIFPGVRMGQCDLSGMDRSQARAALDRIYGSADIDAVIDIQVGDQLFTDRMAAALYGIPAYVVVPRGRDCGWWVRAKRVAEKPFWNRYYKKGGKTL